jgi:hypothetical protein
MARAYSERDALKAMRRQLQDYVRCSLRHDVTTHHPTPHAKVITRFTDAELKYGCGGTEKNRRRFHLASEDPQPAASSAAVHTP